MLKPLPWIVLPLLAALALPAAANATGETAGKREANGQAGLTEKAKNSLDDRKKEVAAGSWAMAMKEVSRFLAMHQAEAQSPEAKRMMVKLQAIGIKSAVLTLTLRKGQLDSLKKQRTLFRHQIQDLLNITHATAVIPKGVELTVPAPLQGQIEQLTQTASAHREQILGNAVEHAKDELGQIERDVAQIKKDQRKALVKTTGVHKGRSQTGTGKHEQQRRGLSSKQDEVARDAQLDQLAGRLAKLVGQVKLLKPLQQGADAELGRKLTRMGSRARGIETQLRDAASTEKHTNLRQKTPGTQSFTNPLLHYNTLINNSPLRTRQSAVTIHQPPRRSGSRRLKGKR